MEEKIHDLIIIGTGPGGLTAAIYAARYKLDVLLIGEILGGLAADAHGIRNYPSFEQISGGELMMKIVEQVNHLKVPLIQDAVINVSKEKNKIKVQTHKETYYAKKLILATGNERRKLGLAREKELTGKGISYCATCDAGFYKNKIVGVIGGGDAALTAALLLKRFATQVYILYRRDKFSKAEPAWIEEVEKSENIKTFFNTEVKELIGESRLQAVKLSNGEELKLDGLFIEIGGTPNTMLAQELNLELENGSIVVDKNQKTSVENVFAAGDVTNRPFKQIITAAGDGATACYSAYKEIEKEKKK